MYALLLDAERRHLDEPGWVDTLDLAPQRRPAPAVDQDRCAGLDSHRIGGEQVCHDLQIARVAYVDERRPCLDQAFALLNDRQDAPGHRGAQLDAADGIRRAGTIPRLAEPRLDHRLLIAAHLQLRLDARKGSLVGVYVEA